ncbi:AraC family transcriptional regulator [Aeribacillus pallidus]|nr:AraC family transcriptional regulator [Aeribacillus pallidus]
MNLSNLFPFAPIDAACLTIKEGKAHLLNHSGQQCILLYTASGSGQLTSSGKEQSIMEGKCYWVETPSLLLSSSKLLTVYLLSWERAENAWLSTLTTLPLVEQSPSKAVPIWKELLLLQKADSLSDRCRFLSLVWNFLSMITDQTVVDGVEEAISFIRNHLSQPFSIAELSTRVGMTPTSFARAFRKKVGMSPKEFVNKARLKMAKELMIQHQGIMLKDVALQVGLQDEFYFSRLFKKKEGISPNIYLKRVQKRVAVISQLFLQDHLLSLGIQPVAAPAYPSVFPSNRGLPAYLVNELEGTLLLNAEKTFDRDEVLQTMPDYIIKTPLHQEQEKSILWTQQSDVYHIPFQTTWYGYLRELASLLEVENRVEPILREMECIERQARDQLCPWTRKKNWAVIWIRPQEIRLYGRTNHAFLDLFFGGLGFEPHPSVPEGGYRPVKVEELAEINPENLLIMWSHEADVRKITHSPEWKYMKAVQNGAFYYPESIEWDPWGPFGRKYMIQKLLKFFQAQLMP